MSEQKYFSVPMCAPSDWEMANKVKDMLVKQFPMCRDARLVLITNEVAKANGMWVSEFEDLNGPHFAVERDGFNQYRDTWDRVMSCMSDWKSGYQQAQEEMKAAAKVELKPAQVNEQFHNVLDHMWSDDQKELAKKMFDMLSPAKRKMVLASLNG